MVSTKRKHWSSSCKKFLYDLQTFGPENENEIQLATCLNVQLATRSLKVQLATRSLKVQLATRNPQLAV